MKKYLFFIAAMLLIAAAAAVWPQTPPDPPALLPVTATYKVTIAGSDPQGLPLTYHLRWLVSETEVLTEDLPDNREGTATISHELTTAPDVKVAVLVQADNGVKQSGWVRAETTAPPPVILPPAEPTLTLERMP